MTTATHLRPLGPIHTDVRQVQNSFDQLWDEAQIESRAFSGNLVALTTSRHLARVKKALAGLQGRYAGRQIIGVMDGNELVGVQVSLVPQKSLYVEQVVLNANPEQLHGAILPLLRPATITHIWWASDEKPEGALLQELTEIADQVIVDSLTLDVPPAAHYSLADLGWSRSAHWREALAQLFDVHDALAQTSHITTLKLQYSGTVDLPARLYAGWVAGTLGWRSIAGVGIEHAECGRENGDLCRVELSGQDEKGQPVRFVLETEGKEMVRSHVRFGDVDRETEVMMPRMSLSEGLARVMARPARGTVFEAAWRMAHESIGADRARKEAQ